MKRKKKGLALHGNAIDGAQLAGIVSWTQDIVTPQLEDVQFEQTTHCCISLFLGNAESVLSCMVIGVIYLLMKKENVLAAILFAVAVHFKVYPMIYAPSIYLLVNEQYGNVYTHAVQTKLRYIISLLWPSDIAWVFAVIGLFITVGLGLVFYSM